MAVSGRVGAYTRAGVSLHGRKLGLAQPGHFGPDLSSLGAPWAKRAFARPHAKHPWRLHA